MSEINDELVDSTLEEEVTPEVTEVEGEDVDVEALQRDLAKAKELAENYKIRAEKAEKAKQPARAETATVSLQDQYALLQANVALEDLDEVQEYAKFKKITIADALKSQTLKAILAEKKEQRDSAAAANISASKRTTGKVTDDAILSKASKGELPQSQDELERLFKLRKGIK